MGIRLAVLASRLAELQPPHIAPALQPLPGARSGQGAVAASGLLRSTVGAAGIPALTLQPLARLLKVLDGCVCLVVEQQCQGGRQLLGCAALPVTLERVPVPIAQTQLLQQGLRPGDSLRFPVMKLNCHLGSLQRFVVSMVPASTAAWHP